MAESCCPCSENCVPGKCSDLSISTTWKFLLSNQLWNEYFACIFGHYFSSFEHSKMNWNGFYPLANLGGEVNAMDFALFIFKVITKIQVFLSNFLLDALFTQAVFMDVQVHFIFPSDLPRRSEPFAAHSVCQIPRKYLLWNMFSSSEKHRWNSVHWFDSTSHNF